MGGVNENNVVDDYMILKIEYKTQKTTYINVSEVHVSRYGAISYRRNVDYYNHEDLDKRRIQKVSLDGEVLYDRAEVRKKAIEYGMLELKEVTE